MSGRYPALFFREARTFLSMLKSSSGHPISSTSHKVHQNIATNQMLCVSNQKIKALAALLDTINAQLFAY